MTAFPKPCGRLDHHAEHTWTCPVVQPESANHHPEYRCIGRVLLEGGYYADWDAEDDAREDELDRQIRDGLADWGRSA